jgi:hypothetical protein
VSAGELLGFDSCGAALHVHNLAAPKSDDHGIPAPQFSVLIPQLRGPDDLVITDASERQILDRPSAARPQDLTGLVWSTSRGRVLPPKVTARRAAPLGVLCEQRNKRFGIPTIQGLGCGAKLLDHDRSMTRSPGPVFRNDP